MSAERASTVLLRFAGDADAARDALRRAGDGSAPLVLSPSQLRNGGPGLSVPECDRLAILGVPPEEEIGHGLASAAVATAMPREVLVIDQLRGRVRRQSAARFLAGSIPGAVIQMAASGAAIAAQEAALRWLGAGSPVPRASKELGRVLYVRPLVGQPTGVGGGITHVHEVIRGLRQRGVEVDAVTPDGLLARTATEDPSPPVRWRVVPVPPAFKAIPASMGAGGDLTLTAAARRSAQASDLIYQRHSRFTLAGALMARLARRPLFLEYNGSEAYVAEHWQPTPLASRLIRCEDAILAAATRVIVVAEAERTALEERGVPADRIVVIPCGVDVERFDHGGGGAVRRQLGIGADERVIGFVGTFGPWHGAPVLARAFVELVRRSSDPPRLLLVGDGEEREEVRTILHEGGALGHTVMVDRVAPSEIPAYLDACDVLASPHVQVPGGREFYGSPTKLFEYMAAAKPIVASSLGQIGSVLSDEETALLVKPGDVTALIAALERALEEPELSKRLGAAARRAAEERHTWRANVDRVIQTYRKLEPAR